MRQARLYHYCLPLNSGQILRGQNPGLRQGFIVQLQQEHKQGWGEIAPLMGFSQETLPQACAATRQWLSLWRSGNYPDDTSPPLPALPCVAFGLSCALAELAQHLPLMADYHPVPLYDLQQRKPGSWSHTITLAKCKTGRADPQQEARQISQLLTDCPHLQLRLDANRSWSRSEAQQFITALHPSHCQRIVFIEEPCHDPAQSCAFSADNNIPIAWDESLRDHGSDIMHLPGVVALIIKPTLSGSLQQVREQIAAAHAHNLTAVISSALESSLGLTQLARLAYWLTPGTPPGLDTLSVFSSQLIRCWPGSTLPCLNPQQLEQIC